MATKVYLIPGVGFVQVPSGGTREYLIPGGGFFSEGAGSPDVEVSASCASLTLTANNATVTVSVDVSVSASCAELSLTEYGATVNAEVSIAANTETLELATYDAFVSFGYKVDCTTGELTLTTYEAGISSDSNIAAGVCNLTLSTHEASISASEIVSANCATLTLTGHAAFVQVDLNITTSPDTLTLRGLSATIYENVNVSATCADFSLATKYAAIEWNSHAVIETGWAKDRNLGPWEFNKPPKKYGYENNPRWVAKDKATQFHKPCGYWPLVYAEIGYYQQSVDMYEDTKVVGAGMIAQDHSHYKLIFLNYETDELIKHFDIYPSVSTNSYYGSITITKKPDGELRIIYINYDSTDLCAYVWDYESSPHKIVLKSDATGYLTSIVNCQNGILVAKDNIADYVYTSVDYGTTWTPYATPNLTGSSWSGMPTHLLYDRNGRIYLIGGLWSSETGYDDKPFIAYYSDNYGETWIEIDHGLSGDDYGDSSNGVYPCVDGDVVCVVKFGDDYSVPYIFISMNKGVSWSAVAAPTVGGVGFLSYSIAAGIKDGVLVLEGNLNDGVDYPYTCVRSVDYGANWTEYHLPPLEIVPTLEKTAYWQFGITDNFWLRTFCGLYVPTTGDLSFMVSVNDSLNWMNRSLHIGARSVDYGPNPVWTMPVS